MRHKAYVTSFYIEARRQTRYRAAALGGIVTQLFFGMVLVTLYHTLGQENGEGPDFFRRTATYVWLQQIFFRAFFNMDSELNEQVLSGNVAYSMLRPVDLHSWWLCRAMAQKLVGVTMRILPMVVLQFLLPPQWRMLGPADPVSFARFLLSLPIGFLVIAQVNLIASAVTMRTLDNRGISGMISLVMMIFSGNIIPLTLLPERLQTVIRLQPFAQMLDAPIRMYLGGMTADEWAMTLGIQLMWLVLLWGLSRWMWRRNLIRIEVQGG